jgi:hypothetical protein
MLVLKVFKGLWVMLVLKVFKGLWVMLVLKGLWVQ